MREIQAHHVKQWINNNMFAVCVVTVGIEPGTSNTLNCLHEAECSFLIKLDGGTEGCNLIWREFW